MILGTDFLVHFLKVRSSAVMKQNVRSMSCEVGGTLVIVELELKFERLFKSILLQIDLIELLYNLC